MDSRPKWMIELADYINDTNRLQQQLPHPLQLAQQQQPEHHFINSHANATASVNVPEWYHSIATLVLLSLYGIVVFAGIFGNASLVITLFSQPSGRLRNPLLVALCLADLLVSGVSMPISIVMIVLAHKTWTLSALGCKAVHYMQVST
jgi:hypothetical protein